jgi:steroid delta-isomerase-like uncharacterized protein
MSEDNIAVTRRIYEEVWNQGNLDVIDELCTADFTDHDPVMGEQDLDAVKETVATYRASFPDLELKVEDVFGSGDKVCARWVANGTFENEMMGQAPTGEKGDPIDGIAIDRFEGGKIAESWGQWNVLRFMQNIGAIPEQEAAAAS